MHNILWNGNPFDDMVKNISVHLHNLCGSLCLTIYRLLRHNRAKGTISKKSLKIARI